MSFENIIKKISAILSAVIVFVMADSFYLSAKGFSWQDGQIVLVKKAEAAPQQSADFAVTPFEMQAEYLLGKDDAPVTIYEFSSFGCPHCAKFHLNILPKLKKDYIDSGKLKMVFVDFPLDKKSMKAVMLSHCMAQDKYHDFLNLLFKKQVSWGLSFKPEKLLAEYAEDFGVDNKKAFKCMNDDEARRLILSLRQSAMEKLQIKGTPAFLIRAENGEEMVYGLPEYGKMEEILNKYLNFNK